MLRVPVLSPDGKPLMPTKSSRARRWIKEEKAVGKFNKLGQFYVQLLVEPSDTKTQSIAVGIDPGKHFSGIGVQSTKFTLSRSKTYLFGLQGSSGVGRKGDDFKLFRDK